jgi:hypothetical protein
MIGLDPSNYGTHSLRRTKVAMVYKRTGNLRACQLLLGHTKLESTVRYLGIEADDALSLCLSRPRSETCLPTAGSAAAGIISSALEYPQCQFCARNRNFRSWRNVAVSGASREGPLCANSGRSEFGRELP